MIEALGGKTTFYGKLNTEVAPVYDTTTFWMSNVAVVLARARIDDGNLRPLGMYGPAQLMQVQQRMGPFWHTALEATPHGRDVRISDYRERPHYWLPMCRTRTIRSQRQLAHRRDRRC